MICDEEGTILSYQTTCVVIYVTFFLRPSWVSFVKWHNGAVMPNERRFQRFYIHRKPPHLLVIVKIYIHAGWGGHPPVFTNSPLSTIRVSDSFMIAFFLLNPFYQSRIRTLSQEARLLKWVRDMAVKTETRCCCYYKPYSDMQKCEHPG